MLCCLDRNDGYNDGCAGGVQGAHSPGPRALSMGGYPIQSICSQILDMPDVSTHGLESSILFPFSELSAARTAPMMVLVVSQYPLSLWHVEYRCRWWQWRIWWTSQNTYTLPDLEHDASASQKSGSRVGNFCLSRDRASRPVQKPKDHLTNHLIAVE